jgi:hypothetical protein
VRLPASYESVTGPALAALRGLTRRHPAGVDVRTSGLVRIQVVLVPILRGSVPRGYGAVLESEVFDRADVDAASAYALERVKVYAADPRVRAGQVAVVARRIGGQS